MLNITKDFASRQGDKSCSENKTLDNARDIKAE